MSGLTLHEIGHERDVLDQFLNEVGGEETPEIKSLLDELTGQRDEKIERWALWLLERSAEAVAIKAEETRLAERRAVLERAIQRSKSQLKYELEAQGIKDVRGKLCSVAIQLNPAKVVGDPSDIQLHSWKNDLSVKPEWALIVKETPASYSLDKKAVLALAAEGVELPPELAIVRETSVRIR